MVKMRRCLALLLVLLCVSQVDVAAEETVIADATCGAHGLCSQSMSRATKIDFTAFTSTSQWIGSLDIDRLKIQFNETGVLTVPSLLDAENVKAYADLYHRMMIGEVDVSQHRHDLGSHIAGRKEGDIENVAQVMWPQLYFNWEDGPLHERATALAQALLGPDMAFDFDMLIYKGPGKDNPFPWHQDEGYWRSGMKEVEFPDIRATSIWIALDDADEENGCMWMVPGSHKHGSFKHEKVKPDHHTIHTGGDVDPQAEKIIQEGKRSYPIGAGGAVLNTGRTLHYTGGNRSPDRARRAYIANFRPVAMVDLERRHGFDHGKKGLGKAQGF